MRTFITSMADDASAEKFVDYLNATREDERVVLARQIHDGLAG